MFIAIEGNRLVNLDLAQIVELRHQDKTATVLNNGAPVAPDSHILYRYFSKLELEKVEAE